MSTTTYDRDYFIAKFEAIPEEQWCVDNFRRADMRCAFGHCGVSGSSDSAEGSALAKVFNGWLIVSRINDGKDARYPQPTPKARILAALRDLPTP